MYWLQDKITVFVFIYAYWSPTRFPYQMMFVSYIRWWSCPISDDGCVLYQMMFLTFNSAMTVSTCLPFRSAWVESRVFVGFVLLNILLCSVCRSLFVLLYFIVWPLHCLFFFHLHFWLPLWYIKATKRQRYENKGNPIFVVTKVY